MGVQLTPAQRLIVEAYDQGRIGADEVAAQAASLNRRADRMRWMGLDLSSQPDLSAISSVPISGAAASLFDAESLAALPLVAYRLPPSVVQRSAASWLAPMARPLRSDRA